MTPTVAKDTTARPSLTGKFAPIPPSNLDAEESVLGAMMLSPLAIGAVTESTHLSAADFYRESHGYIFTAILSLYARGEPADAITVVDELEKTEKIAAAGGADRIHELSVLVPAASNAAHYARIVRSMATLRALIRVGTEISQLGWDGFGEAGDLLDRAEQMIFEITDKRVATEFSKISDLLLESFEVIERLHLAGSQITGTPSGFREIDALTAGFQPGNLVVLAGRPSMGKSALGMNMAANLSVRYGIPVCVFTLEMSRGEVTQRLMAAEGRIDSRNIRTGRLSSDEWSALVRSCDNLTRAPIFIDDSGMLTMTEIRAKSRRLKARHPNLGLVVVDYLQLMTSGGSVENRVQEVSQISRALKTLARDLNTPVLAMSQLSRAVEQRHDKRPILSDLRESGSIEQDADQVMFVYRDEYYNPEDTDSRGVTEIILSKNRHGPTGTAQIGFLAKNARFVDLAGI